MSDDVAYPAALRAIFNKLVRDYVDLESERQGRVRLVIDSSVYLTNEEADWLDALLRHLDAKP